MLKCAVANAAERDMFLYLRPKRHYCQSNDFSPEDGSKILFRQFRDTPYLHMEPSTKGQDQYIAIK
jgi:hypothetical protein